MENKAVAMHIAGAIDIAKCRDLQLGSLIFGDRDELFFKDQDAYIYLFKYGMISYYGYTSERVATLLNQLQPHTDQWQVECLMDDITLKFVAETPWVRVTNNKVTLKNDNVEGIRLTLMHLAQSVALDYFSRLSEQIIKETRKHTTFLEMHGKLDIGGKKLKRHIGKVLNINNQISENLYIFDSHEVTWEDENLDKLDKDLKRIFDLKERYRTIKEQGNIIKENLSLFKDIMDHKESSRLEWIIIILILVEILDMFILRMFK
ncbi:RMD1 family protein [Croceivirga sp. JEA036]|uniref:RMD1 family protein n=1 Tax=Croceivirga sp. JEA036 TaxID=2721162 RepID=UPI00143B9919|nr:RMD1 family protein [Croceivirga sp. JEA036]NJB35261.1 RMD1 family protein [Croceivirga sp. JEA036]